MFDDLRTYVRTFMNKQFKSTPYEILGYLLLLPPVVKIGTIIVAASVITTTPVMLVIINSYLSVLSSIGCITKSTQHNWVGNIDTTINTCIYRMCSFGCSYFIIKNLKK